MKRQRKNFLGIIGLALVTAMTVYASNLPPQKADAVSGGSTTLSVTVLESEPVEPPAQETEIIYPENEERVSENLMDIKINLIKNKPSKVLLINVRTGTQYTFNIPAPTEDGVVETISIDLNDFGGAGDYKISVQALNEDETVYSEDNISFVYKELLPVPVVPDTGSFLQELNLSQTDYIITGVATFLIITAAVLVLKKKSNKR